MISKKDIRIAVDFLASLDIKASVEEDINGSYVLCEVREIVLELQEIYTLERLWSIVFHELCHIICYEEGIYYKYHHNNNKKYNIRYGLRIEKFIDRMAEKLMKDYLPGLEFKPCYGEAECDWYRDYIRNT